MPIGASHRLGKSNYRTIILTLVAAFAACTCAFGQTTTGTITGTVTDAKGAAMSGVSVLIHNADTGIDLPVIMSNDSGLYTAPLLPTGTYDVTASQAGFATTQHKSIVVQVGQTIRIDLEMPVAGQQLVVTVTTDVPVLETEKTEQSQNVSETLVSNLPIATRRWEQFVLLTPGVTPDGTSGAMSFHGLSSFYNNNSVDGAENYNQFNGAARGGTSDGYEYSPDSIQEFQVASSSFGADLGQAAGGSVNAVTKSGTSQLHGDLFYNGRSPDFDAYDPVTKAAAAVAGTQATIPVHQQNQYGGSLGGPLIKDRLFFFATYDGYRKATPVDFTTSQQSPTITSMPCPTAITATQCSAAENWVANSNLGIFPRVLHQQIGLLKLDYQLNATNHLSGVTNVRDWEEPYSTAFATSNNSGATTSGSPNYYQDRFVIGSWTTLIGSNKVNELHYQWGVDNQFVGVNAYPPEITVTNVFSEGQQASYPSTTKEIRNQVSDTFSITRGAHSIKFGADLNFVTDIRRSGTPMAGIYTYSTPVGKIAGCPSSGTQLLFCDWLVDLYGATVPGDTVPAGEHWTSFSQDRDFRLPGDQIIPLSSPVGAGLDTPSDTDVAGFIQDSWKVRSNLTVNLGLRYDVQLVTPETNPNNADAFLAAYDTHLNIDYGGIQPRVGIAWNFDRNTVLRLGAGTFFSKTILSTYSAAERVTGLREAAFTCTPTTVNTVCSGLVFPNLLFNQQEAQPSAPFTSAKLAAAQQPVTPSVLNPSLPSAYCEENPLCAYYGLSPDDVRPRTYQAEFAIERQLPGNMSLSATYILVRGNHIPDHYDVNEAPATVNKTYDVLSTAGVNTSGVPGMMISAPFFTNRIDPTLGPVDGEISIVNSWYNAMVLTLRKPMSGGVELLANYTLSKAEDDGAPFASLGGQSACGSQLEGQQTVNPYNKKEDYSLSGVDDPNRFTASIVWQPPYAKRLSNKIERGFIDGWSLSSAITATNGTHYNASISSAAVQCLAAVTSCAGGVTGLDGGMCACVLQSVSVPGGGRATFLPRAAFELPNYFTADLRLQKETPIHERYNIEFRIEAFNALNSTIVTGVNTSAYTYAQPGQTSGGILCPSVASGNTSTCMVPSTSFQQHTTTTSNLLGARQMQAGLRFDF